MTIKKQPITSSIIISQDKEQHSVVRGMWSDSSDEVNVRWHMGRAWPFFRCNTHVQEVGQINTKLLPTGEWLL